MNGGQTLVLLGGGGHGAVVAEAARTCGWTVTGYLDDAAQTEAARLVGLERLGAIDDLDRIPAAALGHAAVGDPTLRRRWLPATHTLTCRPLSVIWCWRQRAWASCRTQYRPWQVGSLVVSLNTTRQQMRTY